MDFLTKSVWVKQWLLFVMILLSGYAVGAIVAKLANALGI
jgi:hypothetical protein